MGRYAPATMISQCKYSALPSWIEERSVREISQGAKLCFARLIGYARSNGYAFPALKKLANDIGVSDKQVRRYVHQLEKIGLIDIEYQAAEPSRFYLIDDCEWFPAELKKNSKKITKKSCDKNNTKSTQKDSEKLSTDVDTYVQGGMDIYVPESGHICPGGLDTYVQGSRHICPDINNNKQINKQINKQLTNARTRAKGRVFDLFEDAGLNSQDENLHFSQAISSYPKNPHHRNLYAIQKIWVERRIDGFSSEQLLAGVKKYRTYCDGINITGKQSVMSLARFFGDELNFDNQWDEELARYKKENNPYSRYD